MIKEASRVGHQSSKPGWRLVAKALHSRDCTTNIMIRRHYRHTWLTLCAIMLQIIILEPTDSRFIKIYTRKSYLDHSTNGNEQDSQMTSLANATGGFMAEPSNDVGHTIHRSIEYMSPMKRIMELIGSHAPIIVVSSPSGEQNNADPSATSGSASQQTMAGQSTDSPMARPQTGSSNNQNINSNHQQHWTLLDPSQMMEQMHLTTQQQQLYQTSVPYGQYYLAEPSQLTGAQSAGQVTMLPAGFSTYGIAPAFPLSTQQQQQQILAQQVYQQQVLPEQQPSAMPASNGLDDNIQPIFLSSYVPEISAQAAPAKVGPVSALLLPNSIQQIQQTQTLDKTNELRSTKTDAVAKKAPATQAEDSAQEDSSELEKGDRGAKDPEEPHDEPSDLEEANKTKRSSSTPREPQEAGEEPTSNGGSLSYEDKYDSDKDEQGNGNNQVNKGQPTGGGQASSNSLVAVGLNDDCLQCICRASSGCDHHLRCITRGAEEKYCGPFQLTEDYWTSAGSPGDANNNFQSFEECANEPDCAVETVTNYMKKHHKDCDGDENITCLDYARLHRLKPDECDNTNKLVNDFDAYWAKFQLCAEGYNRSRNGDDEDI